MNRLKTNANTLDILKYIMRHNKINRNDWTINITGRIGPTGKTWLCNELVKAGYKAKELSQFTMARLLSDDGMNHVIVDEDVKQVVVVLNEILPMYEDKWRKVSDFNPDDVYTFDIRREADHVLWVMVDIAEEYGVVTRADFKDLIGRKCDSDDYHYGWLPDAIRKARVLRTRDGWMIEFPKALPVV